jgi:hypothetical protein
VKLESNQADFRPKACLLASPLIEGRIRVARRVFSRIRTIFHNPLLNRARQDAAGAKECVDPITSKAAARPSG